MMNYNTIFQDRAKRMAISVIEEVSALPYSDSMSVIRKQIIRFSTSVTANYRSMCRARSEIKGSLFMYPHQ